MFLDDVSVTYSAVIVAAIVYFILGAIWYAPFFFGHCSAKHDEACPVDKEGKDKGCQECGCKIVAYVGEFILDLITAYILAVVIQLSQATEIAEGISVAIWMWIGFVATTHFSSVLWGYKTLKSFFIYACFMLLGFIAMGATLIYLS